MKIFIGWSGDLSESVALVLREWIAVVLPFAQPFVSSEDIAKGSRWAVELSAELDTSDCSIFCLTPGNTQAPWLNFEAGAASKPVVTSDNVQTHRHDPQTRKSSKRGERKKVHPFLLGLGKKDLVGPLSQFQTTAFARDDMQRLAQAINEQAGAASIPKERLDRYFKVCWPYLDQRLADLMAPSPSISGRIPRTALAQDRRLPGEVFAAELLRRPIRIEKQPANRTVIHIDRGGVIEAVISSEGKRLLCEEFVTPKQEVLRRQDADCQRFLLDSAARDSKALELSTLPLRWASGGILSVVNHKGRTWIPLFFRDIRPYGWNVAMGSSERYFDDRGNSVGKLEDELNNPAHFIAREFLEETLILDKAPAPGQNTSRPVLLPSWHGATENERPFQITAKHLSLRDDYDHLRISPYGSRSIRAFPVPTKMSAQVAIDEGRPNVLTDVLVCLNLLELGIEVVKVISYNLEDDDYLLDGEVLELEPPELTRMPAALISVDYLESAFSNKENWTYTAGPQASAHVLKPLSEQDIRIFEWDICQRLKIVRGEKKGKGTELKRYLDWYDKFHANFFDQQDQPYAKNPSRLFTPATAKILSLYFDGLLPKGVLNGGGTTPA